MKKATPKDLKAENSVCWIEIESGTPEPLEVRIGSCVVRVPSVFDKASLTEVCKVLLSL